MSAAENAFTAYLTRFDGSISIFPSFTLNIGGNTMQEYETLKRLVAEAEEDVGKAIGGNKAAGTRVRKKMQEIKAAAQEVRKKVLEGREAEPA
ncbi:MAG TPA: hypothetical protein VK968_12185 [Roseimicrobium sp.]|nr:hypothetical protein [Roseimicrobium sp.]